MSGPECEAGCGQSAPDAERSWDKNRGESQQGQCWGRTTGGVPGVEAFVCLGQNVKVGVISLLEIQTEADTRTEAQPTRGQCWGRTAGGVLGVSAWPQNVK